MIRRILISVALCLVVAGCSSGSDAPAPATRAVSSPPTPVGSPQAATPTAMLAIPAPSATPPGSPPPLAAASPSPVAAASPAPAASPYAAASPAAAGSPVAIITAPVTAAPAGGLTAGPRYEIVQDRSEASYRAREKFVSQPAPNEAVGRTNDVEGEIQLEAPGVLRGRIILMRVDLRTLVSDQARRDNFIRQNTLQTDQFPYAEFRSTEAAGPGTVTPGEEVSFKIPGLMTIKGQERPVVWDARASLEGTTLSGTATLRVKLTDFGIEPPRLAILSVEDEMTWQVDLVAEQVR
ncbi:MAG: YceI family protein [Chloroflexota bacterium]